MNLLFFLTPKQDVCIVNDHDSIRQVLEKMEHHGYSAIPILNEEGQYVGTITEGDILWFLRKANFPSMKEIENTAISTVPRKRDNKAILIDVDMEALVDHAMNQNFVPIIDDHAVFIGIVTRKDLISYLSKNHTPENKCGMAI